MQMPRAKPSNGLVTMMRACALDGDRRACTELLSGRVGLVDVAAAGAHGVDNGVFHLANRLGRSPRRSL